MLDQRTINDFTRKYFNLSIKKQEGVIHHDPGTSKAHRALVNSICEWANDNNFTFFTRVHLKEGKIVDIVIPELVKPFIEVRASEESKEKEYLEQYKGMIQFVDCSNPYDLL